MKKKQKVFKRINKKAAGDEIEFEETQLCLLEKGEDTNYVDLSLLRIDDLELYLGNVNRPAMNSFHGKTKFTKNI